MEIYAAEKLRRMALEVRHLREHVENLDQSGSPSFEKSLREVILLEAVAIELHNTSARIREVLQSLNQYSIPSSRRALLEELETLIRLDLSTVRFVHIPQANREYLFDGGGKWFGPQVTANLPGATYDILEARNCLAVGCDTACVFHLMRVLEVALRGVAKSLKIPDPLEDWERNWTKILDKINNQRKSAIWVAEKDFYENAYAYFQAVKNPWRNATMHVTGVYDHTDARRIFHAVSALIQHLVTKITE